MVAHADQAFGILSEIWATPGNGYFFLLTVCSAICPASFSRVLPICMGAEHFGK